MKKGFTLTEMLAVIVIIAILNFSIVIGVPKILDQGKRKITESSTMNYVSAVETYLKAAALDSSKIKLPENNTYNVADVTIIDGVPYQAINTLIEVDGKYPTEGTVTIDDNYTVLSANLTLNGFKVVYDKENKITSFNPA